MLKTLFVSMILIITPLPVFALSDFDLVIASLKNDIDKQYQNELTQNNLTNISAVKNLVSSYIVIANTINELECQQLNQLNYLLDENKTITIQTTTQDDQGNRYLTCNKLNTNTMKNLTDKLLDKAIKLATLSIINGGIDTINLLIHQYKLAKISEYRLINIVNYLKKHQLKSNPYAMYFMGQLYLNEIIWEQYGSKMARELFEQIIQIDEQEILYFIALAKIKETIENHYWNETDNYHIVHDQDSITPSDNNGIVRMLAESANLNNTPTLLFMSYLYSDIAINKSLTYFKRACVLTTAAACEVYTDIFKRPQQQEIYTLLQKFDKENPDYETSKAIGKWYESQGKYINAINYYSYVIDKNPKLLLEMATLYAKVYRYGYSYIENDIINLNASIQCYSQYLNYVNDTDIKYQIYQHYRKLYELRGRPENGQKAIAMLEEVAMDGNTDAQLKVAEEYKWGNLSQKNYSKSAYWYHKYCTDLTTNDHPDFCAIFTKIDAFPKLQEKADQGDMNAQYQIGKILIDNYKLRDIGENYLKQARAQGSQDAEMMLLRYKIMINFSG